MRDHLLDHGSALHGAAFAICLTAFSSSLFPSDLHLTIQDTRGLRATFRDSKGHDLVPAETLVRWADNSEQTSHRLRDGAWSVDLDSRGLTAVVKGPVPGEYGEHVFQIELENHGSRQIVGVLSPPFTKWAKDETSIRMTSDQHMVLSSDHVTIGTLGAHKAWSAGSEFEADMASIVPTSDGKQYLSAVLVANPGELVHHANVLTLQPGQSCHYALHLDTGRGSRNDGLREMYRVRGGYRVHPADYRFDDYDDPELSWARDVVATWLDWAWDKANLDPRSGTYHFLDSLAKAKVRFGGYDAFILWPFWPRAGFDDRSQFDHYRDMPGGLPGLREQIEQMHNIGVHTFISYCHWSESDRDKSAASMTHSYDQFAKLACELNADGALMDLMSKTPDEILTRASECGRKLVPYNEGDPTWSDTQTNLIGRIHNDVAMPEFNLKKYMLPHHAQLRVCEPGNTGKRMRNDFVLSFFNGHGVEINTMFPGNNPATEVDWPILSRALDLLRTNRAAFRSPDWQPLIPSMDPAVWINSWPTSDAALYTLCGTSVAGHHGPLLRIRHTADVHYVDLWRYRRLTPVMRGEDDVLSYDVD